MTLSPPPGAAGVRLTRKALVASIEAMASPHFRDSGYVKHLDPKKGLFGPKRPLRLWAPRPPLRIGGFVLDEVVAITEDGIIDDATGGGAMQSGYGCFPLEDLLALQTALAERLPAGRAALSTPPKENDR